MNLFVFVYTVLFVLSSHKLKSLTTTDMIQNNKYKLAQNYNYRK